MSNEELRKNESAAEKVAEGVDKGDVSRRKARRKNRIKETVIVYAMMIFMIMGVIAVFFVPHLYYENKTLQATLESYEEMAKNEESSQLIRDFSDYLDNVDVSKGMSWENLMEFEKNSLEYEMIASINKMSESVYAEKAIIAKLEEAYQNTKDQDMKESLQIVIDSHRQLLTEKEQDLAEYEEFYFQYKEMQKMLEEEFEKIEKQPINMI